ncbi:MAG: hypothetical protein KA735_04785 [Burkholderiaceae bacterium]|nr:hypothetical protein [Burkholderiaceae bacterium]
MNTISQQDNNNPLSDLISNAYEFLESALENLEKNPKSSVIDFYTAVELFLKAPLLKEHWSLIVSKDPDIRKFKTGDFISTSFDETVRRLRSTLEAEISADAKKSFDDVRKHRNQFVHFYKNNPADSINKIALEQFKAWAHLHNLITSKFVDVFQPYIGRAQNIERKLKRHQEFWAAHALLKFKELQPYLAKERELGANIVLCRTCNVDSFVWHDVCGTLEEGSCKICRSHNRHLTLECPSCAEDMTLENDGYSWCGQCHAEMTPEILYDLVDTAIKHHRPGDVVEHLVPANCVYCDGYESICEYHDRYLCTSCLVSTDSLSNCEYCSSPSNGNNEDTYASGCSFCDGAIGNIKD